jgi:lysophospholipase L1-like esterase
VKRPDTGSDAGIGTSVTGLRICVVGDEFVAGAGDPRSLGWVGRVAARTSREAGPVTAFPLGVPDETTGGLLQRWRQETERRFGSEPESGRLVLGIGPQDPLHGLSLPRSRLNLANILDEAHSRSIPVFVVGPPPCLDDRLNPRIAELSAAFQDVCERRRVIFVDTFAPLLHHEDWLTDLAAGDGIHPSQAGYGLMAWLVLHTGWHAWLGLPQP